MRYQAAIQSTQRALELLDPTNPMHFVAQLLHALLDNVMGGHRDAMTTFRGFAEMFDVVGPGPHVAGLAEYTAIGLFAGDDFATASRILDAMIEYARRESVLGLLPLPLSARAELRWRSGSWAGALADATESLAIVNETDQYVERSHSLMMLGKLQSGVGRIAEARGLLQEAFVLADECDGDAIRFMGSSAFGFVELSACDFGASRRHLLRCRDLAARSGDHDPTLWPWRAELVEVAAKLGEHALARKVSAKLDEDAARHGGNQAGLMAARSRGLVASDETAMHEAFEESFGYLDALPIPLPFERARTQLLFGECLLEHHRSHATEHLGHAIETFDTLGAHPWSARGRVHLASREQGRSTTVFEQLTERELQVAMAVSTGKTSREAASELFLSRRTVEHHLAAVYRKLGIRNRTQLASLFN
jgi:DNA-binding CsgD family transcriptional regulator